MPTLYNYEGRLLCKQTTPLKANAGAFLKHIHTHDSDTLWQDYREALISNKTFFFLYNTSAGRIPLIIVTQIKTHTHTHTRTYLT